MPQFVSSISRCGRLSQSALHSSLPLIFSCYSRRLLRILGQDNRHFNQPQPQLVTTSTTPPIWSSLRAPTLTLIVSLTISRLLIHCQWPSTRPSTDSPPPRNSPNGHHDLALALWRRFSVFSYQSIPRGAACWLSRCLDWRAAVLEAGQRGSNLYLHSPGQEVWLPRGGDTEPLQSQFSVVPRHTVRCYSCWYDSQSPSYSPGLD